MTEAKRLAALERQCRKLIACYDAYHAWDNDSEIYPPFNKWPIEKIRELLETKTVSPGLFDGEAT